MLNTTAALATAWGVNAPVLCLTGQVPSMMIGRGRGQLHELPDQLAIIREDNAFRYDKDVLPAAEGAALWAAFNVEMDRLYGVMNEGKEPDLGD